jgi:hypothetical protein
VELIPLFAMLLEEGGEAWFGGEFAVARRPGRNGAGQYSLYVWKKRCANVVPKKAPSTPLNLLEEGVYMSLQLGQNSLTVSTPGMSERPQGMRRVEVQYTLKQLPKTPFSYFSA